jgi:hypothetical protein
MRINQQKIRSNKFVQSMIRFANSNFVARIVIAIIIWVFALIPTWIYFTTRWLIGPETFWQEFAIFCIFAICIGWLQAILIFFGGVLTLVAIFDDL